VEREVAAVPGGAGVRAVIDGFVHDRETWDAAYGRKASSRVLYTDGDAVVTQAAGRLPEPFREAMHVYAVSTHKGHRQLLLDAKVVQRVADFLGEADQASHDAAPRREATATTE
jgi:hypothetical protein